MKSTIDRILSQVDRNYPAKAWNYDMFILGPGTIPDATPDLMLQCAGVQIPGMNLGVAQERRHTIGNAKSLPVSKSFTEITLTMYESEREIERFYFSQWMNSIYVPESKRFNFYNDIVKTIKLVQYDTTGRMTYECYLYECWPSNISPIDKSYTAGDTVSQFTANIQFHDVKEIFYDLEGQDSSRQFSIFNIFN